MVSVFGQCDEQCGIICNHQSRKFIPMGRTHGVESAKVPDPQLCQPSEYACLKVLKQARSFPGDYHDADKIEEAWHRSPE